MMRGSLVFELFQMDPNVLMPLTQTEAISSFQVTINSSLLANIWVLASILESRKRSLLNNVYLSTSLAMETPNSFQQV